MITRDDFQDLPSEFVPAGEMLVNYRDMVRNVLAREKVLYEGHAVAAVAATSAKIAKEALKLIEVEYEPLPHVIDVVEAMADDAPLLHEDMFTAGVEPAPTKPSNVSKRVEFALGDTAAGFAEADIVVEREFDTKPVHQGYIEPHACVASFSEDGQAELWCSTQGHFIVRGHCAKMLGMDIGKLRVSASEIGGGFGGKTVVYLEPLALALSRKAHQPVKMVMTRDEVFRATGPTSGRQRLGQDRRHEGRPDHRRRGGAQVPGRRVPGRAGAAGRDGAFAPYDLENVKVVGYDVVTNRPKVRGLPRARRADLRVRGRVRDRRAGQEARHGPDRVPPEERGQGGHARRLRAEVRPGRPDRDARGGQGARPLPGAARAEPGPRRRLGLLVQHRRRDLRPRST